VVGPVTKTPAANSRVEQWVRPELRALSAYHIPPAADLIKLDAMENPYTWPPALVEAWLAVLRGVSLNRYPDPNAAALKARLRAALHIPDAMDILLGNGSDELIQMTNLALAGPGRVVLAPEPAFSMYRIIATATGMGFVGVPLDDDFDIDLDAALAALAAHRPAVVYIDYPNNPSGNLFDAARLNAVIEAAPGLVVVDEAYYPYAGRSLMGQLTRHDNLVIMRTLSKFGLAGLRLGLMIGPRAWLEEINKTRLPYNVNVLTQASAEFALGNMAVLEEQARTICADRERMIDAMRRVDGIIVYPSHANFILFRVAAGRAARVYENIKSQGVLIRSFIGSTGVLGDCLRVTVGTPEENRAFIAALRGAL
jgi:histidinol-phosphate aminotransferase